MHARTQYTPLTAEEQCFAESNHYVVEQFLKRNRLEPDDWYDVVIFRYLLSVKKWHQEPELHKWKFSTIAGQGMRSAVGNEKKKDSRRIQTISLDGVIPGTEDMTYMDKITADNLDYINYGEEDMNISYNTEIPARRRWGGAAQGDDVIALETFLKARKHRNMCIGYDSREEAKRRCSALQSYRRTHKLQEEIEVYRVDEKVYVVKIEGGRK